MKKILIPFFLILVLITIPFIISYLNNKNSNNYDFKIYFFSAGKADAIILSKDNKYIMIDTGEESLSGEILEYFKNNNITKLDYLIITHFDKDHIGSASAIIQNIEIGEVLQSNSPKDSEYYDNYLEALNKMNITPLTISNNYEIELSDLKITVNGPEIIYDNNESNNSSLIVSIKYNNQSFLFMGDAMNARIKDFIETNNETYNFIKIPYHGNYLKQLSNLLINTNPTYGVITCSKTDGCDEETLDLLKEYHINYYLTYNGCILVLSDGNNLKIIQ